MLTPRDATAGLVCFRLAAAPSPATLQEHGVTVRRVPESDALRASCAFFNTEAEIDRLIACLREGA